MVTTNYSQTFLKGILTNDNRFGETGPIPFRSKRFYFNGKEWFFRSRHGERHGPFMTYKEADEALKRFLHHQAKLFRYPRL